VLAFVPRSGGSFTRAEDRILSRQRISVLLGCSLLLSITALRRSGYHTAPPLSMIFGQIDQMPGVVLGEKQKPFNAEHAERD